VKDVLKKYYSLTKPGVLYGNVLSAAAGFLLASRGSIDSWLFLATIVGTTLVIASACVINNFLDQDIDQLMERTKKRAIVAGDVKGSRAVIFSIVLGLLGMLILVLFTSWLVVAIGLAGFVAYVVLYGMLSKRLSIHGTLVGSISGAAPILAGYVAAAGQIDAGAIIVFLVLFFWQMPEFYSISIYRHDEYKAAGVPVMSVVKGVKSTKIQIFVYALACVAAIAALTIFGQAGWSYFVVMMLLSARWVWLGVIGLTTKNNDAWARQMFHFSLIILLAFCLMISIDNYVP
jgi:protoheme IX farnesyltransferase